MSLDHLRTNEFWNKKIHQAIITQDVNKDKVVSRADFDLIVQRYKETGASPEHVKKHQESFEKLLEVWGMADESVEFTIEEFEEMFRQNLEKSSSLSPQLFTEWFHQVDINENGVVSLKEWIIHCSALNISKENAEKSYRAMDTNKDGVISLEEFVEYHKEFFFSAEDKLHSSILYGPLP